MELALNGYDLFRQDRPVDPDGGGVLLYIRSTLNAVPYPLATQFPEQIWCYFVDAIKRVSFLCWGLLPNTIRQCVWQS